MNAYMITCTLNGKKYIGISVNVNRRWTAHKRKALRHPTHALHCAMAKYGNENFSFEVIASARTYKDLLFLERLLIKQHESLLALANGYNMTEGGEGALGYRHTKENIERQKMRIISSETKERISATMVARNWSPPPEHMAKLIASATGRRMSDKTRASMSALHKGKIVSQDTRDKMRLAKVGVSLSAENIASLRARRQTPEWRAKMSDRARGQKLASDHPLLKYWQGKTHSDETRAKMSASAKAIYGTEEFKKRRTGVKRSEQTKKNMRDGHARAKLARLQQEQKS